MLEILVKLLCITQNKLKLGANIKDVLQYLEGPKVKRVTKPKPSGAAPTQAAAAQAAKSAEVVVEDEEEVEEVEEGGEEDLRRRELQDDIDESDGEDIAAPPVDEVEDEIMGD